MNKNTKQIIKDLIDLVDWSTDIDKKILKNFVDDGQFSKLSNEISDELEMRDTDDIDFEDY